MPTYAEFRVRIERGVTSRSYKVVASGPRAGASGRLMLPYSDLELENFVLRLGRTRRGIRRVDSPEMEQAKAFGTKLFDAVFEGDVKELYRSSLADASDAGQGLRLTLALTDAPELLQVPWEYLYDRPNFLSISTWTPIVRYLELPKPPRPLQIAFPLRILGMVSSPSDAEPIQVDEEKAKLEKALSALVESGVVAIDWLESASLLALTRQLRRADYHVFHYIGHGGFDNEAKDGVLLFEDDQGRSVRVGGAQLGDILHDEKSLRLAVLNACEGARTSIEDPFAGVATSLIEREIPAVIGMQFEITDRAAIVFASEFYSTLADGQPVDSAMSEARKSIYAMGNDIEWGTPVLFMRVQDGRLFDVQPHAPVPRPDPVAVAIAATAPAAPEGAVRRDEVEVSDPPESTEAAEVAERERLAAEAAELVEREWAAAEAAERERDRQAAERDRQAAEAAERERLAAEAAERDRLAAEAAERDRQAAEAAERDRLAAEAAEQARLAAEAAEAARRQREAEEGAERDRRAAAETEALRQRLAALEAGQTEQALRQRQEQERAARERVTAAQVPTPAWDPQAVVKKKSGFGIGRLLAIVLVLVVAAVAWDASQGLLNSPGNPFEPTADPFEPTADPFGSTAFLPSVLFLSEDDARQVLAEAGFTDVSSTSLELSCEEGFSDGQVAGVVNGGGDLVSDVDVLQSEPLTIVVASVSC